MKSIPLALLIAIGPTLLWADQVEFNRDIRPILSDKCYRCHGPDKNTRQAGLRLDVEDEAKASAIDTADPEQSLLIERVTSNDPDERMPPPDSNLVLSEEEISLLRKWIEQGANWSRHWSFEPLTKPPLPAKQNEWAATPIDRFTFAAMSRAQFQPNKRANPATLLRRLTFDITGLPPTVEELTTFLQQDGSDEAYESAVDRLLASPRYGERMASEWLDVARYSDTYGYQVDRDRFVWPYRDWVIRAYNENMPYDQFVTEQLAGDLLPDSSDQQILATAFNRLHPQKVEGGSVPEEFRTNYVADRTQTFATAMLGLTMECCRCHDHKYDPLSQRDYYSLSSFFDNIDEAGLYSFFTNSIPTPTLVLQEPAQRTALQEAREAVSAAEQSLRDREASPESPLAAVAINARQPEGAVAKLDFEQPVEGANRTVPGRIGSALELTGDDEFHLKVGNFARYQPFTIALWMQVPRRFDRAVVFHRSRAWTDAGSRGYQLLLEDGRLSASLIHFWPGNAIRIRATEDFPLKQWTHVALVYDGSSRASGLKLFVNGQLIDSEVVRDRLKKNITGGGGDNLAIGARFRDHGFTNGLVDEMVVFDRQLSRIEVAALHDPEADPKTWLVDSQHAAEWYRLVKDEAYRSQLDKLRGARQRLCELQDRSTEIMVMRELPAERPTYLLDRGAYDSPTEVVKSDTPSALPPFPRDMPRNRLGLARWLTQPDHPLTARVAVNRYWQLIFGEGLVRTPEDFGSQGQLPTHPELLDWLAGDFAEHDWDIKRLIKQMVMSSTYRQSSWTHPEMLARDPENRWLARGPTYRLSAEMLRDQALAVSSLLVDRLGGPPVRPYEINHSFKPSKPDDGEGLYRRSLYTYWKQTAPAPAMITLDASKRDVCRMRRERTSSPLQAFVLFNGPQYVEASRALAENLMHEFGDSRDSIVVSMFQRLTSQEPTQKQSNLLYGLWRDQLEAFRSDQSKVDAYLDVGNRPADSELDRLELAAWTSVVATLMNYDQCVMKR